MSDPAPQLTEAELERMRNLQWSDIQDANGVDLTLIDYMLSLTPTQRLEHLDELQRFDEVLTHARVKFYGSDPRLDLEAELERR
jgi:hypothetical protein